LSGKHSSPPTSLATHLPGGRETEVGGVIAHNLLTVYFNLKIPERVRYNVEHEKKTLKGRTGAAKTSVPRKEKKAM
jgi:hypothetical protein